MTNSLSRRRFLAAGAIGALALAQASPRASTGTARTTSRIKPVVVSSANGNKFRNGGESTCVATAYQRITEGADVLDALIAGVNINELDPADDSVGFGGIPNADGVVQLDSSCMHGRSRRAGAVAALEGVRTPSLVAKAVLDNTDHHLLVGAGAQNFARQLGFTIDADLNSAHSREIWLEWKRRIDPQHFLDPAKRAELWQLEVLRLVREHRLGARHLYGTINCNAINANGDLAGVTTTSGLSFKIPGRVGDSPILGAGLYVDNAVGAAGSTGRGEANLYNLSSFLIIEELRRGAHPKDAGLTALHRVRANTVEKRLLSLRGLPNFGLSFYIIDAQGRHAGVSMYAKVSYPGDTWEPSYAVCDENGPRTQPCEPLLEEHLVISD